MKKISLIIPVFCNQESLKKLFAEINVLKKNLIKRNIFLQIIVIDDNSTDSSFKILEKLFLGFKDIVLIKHLKNLGPWQAIKTGLNFVKGNAFTYISADRQEPIELVTKMIEKWKKGNKIVIAERINRTDDYLNIFLSNFYSFIIRLFFFKNYPKKNFDIALIDSHYLFHFKNNLETSYIPFKIYSLGLDISKVSYIRLPREFGKSKFTFLKRLEIIFEIFFSYSKISFRLFFLFGVLLSFFSFFYALFIVSYNLTNPVEVKGFPTIAFLLSFFSGIILLLIAILGEFILKVYNQNKNIETVNYKIFIDKIYKR